MARCPYCGRHDARPARALQAKASSAPTWHQAAGADAAGRAGDTAPTTRSCTRAGPSPWAQVIAGGTAIAALASLRARTQTLLGLPVRPCDTSDGLEPPLGELLAAPTLTRKVVKKSHYVTEGRSIETLEVPKGIHREASSMHRFHHQHDTLPHMPDTMNPVLVEERRHLDDCALESHEHVLGVGHVLTARKVLGKPTRPT